MHRSIHHTTEYWVFDLLLTGSALWILSCLPFDVVKQWGNSLARDGNFESLQFEGFQHLRIILIILGIFLLCLAIFIHFQKNRFEYFLQTIKKKTNRFISQYFRHCKIFSASVLHNLPAKDEWPILASIMLLAAGLRICLLFRPLEYDEAYTFNEFARHSFSYIISEYYVVNNHIFHTLLVKFSTLILGDQPWAIRMPVFIAGLLLVFTGYQITKRLFSVPVARLAAFLIACMPILIDKSASARGYMLISLFFFMSIHLSLYLTQRKNYFAWSLLSLLMALGIFVNPIMLYPFAICSVWLLITGLQGGISEEYKNKWEWLVFLCLFGFFSGILSILFYSHVFRHYGIFTVFNGNQVVDSLTYSQFFQHLPEFFKGLYLEWKTGFSKAYFMLLLLGYLVNFSFRKELKRQAALLLIVVPFTWFILILVQRPRVISRIWIWLLPLILIGAAAGSLHCVKLIKGKIGHFLIMIPLLFYLFLFGYHAINFVYPYPFTRESDIPIVVTECLKPIMTKDDIVVVSMDADARYWYYFNQYDLPEDSIRGIKNRPFRTAYIIVNSNNYEDLESVLHGFGPDRFFLDLATEKKIFQVGNTILYRIRANSRAIESQFGESSLS
jgi:hypothetical protein